MRFEDYLYQEIRDSVMHGTQADLRRATREEKRKRRFRVRITAALAALAIIAAIFFTACQGEAAGATGAAEVRQQETPETAEPTVQVLDLPAQEDFENEKIEQALFDQGYFRSDIPLDGDTQAFLHAACEESGVEYTLVLAVIYVETGFRNVSGDDGDSLGYMQIQPKWHRARMERLGVSDLTDPFGNFRVGCDYLSELLSGHTEEEALTAYNTGRYGKSAYADRVLSYKETLEKG